MLRMFTREKVAEAVQRGRYHFSICASRRVVEKRHLAKGYLSYGSE